MSKERVMNILASKTDGKSYKAYKYSLDTISPPSIEYDEETHQGASWKDIAEDKPLKGYKDLSERCKSLLRSGDQTLTYFLDGSRRVFKVDDIAYDVSGGRKKIYPVVAGQIGIGCCRRENKRMSVEEFKGEAVISLPDIADANGTPGFFPALAELINGSEEVKRSGLRFSSIFPYKTSGIDSKKYVDKGIALIQQRMMKKEIEMVAELVRNKKLDQDNYLVKDGSLEYRPDDELIKDSKKYKQYKNNYRWVLGLSKNFNPEICYDNHGKPNPGYIADLRLYHRTPVARFENQDYLGDIQFAVWYIRIRDKMNTRTPFDGIVKVEKILVGDEVTDGIDTQSVDYLSAQIINERSPACYASDNRWANHIYPIYLTERYVKSRYLSNESFLHLF